MPTSLTQTQTLKRLLKEYIECVAGFREGDCEVLRRSIKNIARSINNELSNDALRLVDADDYEP